MPNPIQVKRSDVVEDIRALAAFTGASITDTIANAVRAQLAIERVKASAKLSKRRVEAERLLADLRRLPVVGPDLSDRDLYDADGMPK